MGALSLTPTISCGGAALGARSSEHPQRVCLPVAPENVMNSHNKSGGRAGKGCQRSAYWVPALSGGSSLKAPNGLGTLIATSLMVALGGQDHEDSNEWILSLVILVPKAVTVLLAHAGGFAEQESRLKSNIWHLPCESRVRNPRHPLRLPRR